MKSIETLAKQFRAAIEVARAAGEFNGRDRFYGEDRMSYFPRGCCDDSCDLLAHYLNVEYSIHTKQRVGTYRDSNPNNTANHVWLVMDDNAIIDITADQFEFFSRYAEGVYVGKENSFYKFLEDKDTYGNHDIMKSPRLQRDYQIIMNYLIP